MDRSCFRPVRPGVGMRSHVLDVTLYMCISPVSFTTQALPVLSTAISHGAEIGVGEG